MSRSTTVHGGTTPGTAVAPGPSVADGVAAPSSGSSGSGRRSTAATAPAATRSTTAATTSGRRRRRRRFGELAAQVAHEIVDVAVPHAVANGERLPLEQWPQFLRQLLRPGHLGPADEHRHDGPFGPEGDADLQADEVVVALEPAPPPGSVTVAHSGPMTTTDASAASSESRDRDVRP